MTTPNSPSTELTSEIRLLRVELSTLRRELAEVEVDCDGFRNEASGLRHQLQVLRRSISWRLTMPLRSIRRRVFRRGEF
jgi:hypothetical protein